MVDQNPYRKGKRLVACRECQRLKLKCNRSWPCESCIKRGVEDICPEGVLPTTKRQRSNLIDTSRLHENNVQMSVRIRDLEAALVAMQSAVSNESHPLLKEELLALGTPLELPQVLEGIKPAPKLPTVEDTIEAFGTLAIGANGRTIFHSQAVSADYLVEPPWTTKSRDRSIAEAMSLTPEIIGLGTLFPFGDTNTPLSNLKHQILGFFPPAEKAAQLVQNYFDYFSWWLDPIPREQFDKEVLPVLSASPDMIQADRLSVLFMIFGIGSFLDLKRPVDLTSSDSFWQLSRATFCLEPLLDVSTTYTIQALQLMAAYLHVTSRQKVEHQWVILGLIARIIHSSGLHYDGEHWIKNIKDDHIVERRRKIFNEALAYDAMMSFTMGRPPAFVLAHVQSKLPIDEEKVLNESGVEEIGLSTWRYRFTKECLYPVMDEAFGAKPPSYSTILRLDRKLREFPVPSHLVYPGLGSHPEEPNPDQISFRKWMQRAYLFGLKETSEIRVKWVEYTIDNMPGLLYLHRSHFSQALLDHPENPFQGKYAASVLAAFRSASRIVAGVRDISTRYMMLVSRIWWIWQNLFSAGIVLGMLVLRAPRCKLASSALVELNQACELLQDRVISCRSEHSRRLLERVRSAAESAFREGKPIATFCGLGMFNNDELVIFTPAARTVSRGDYQEPDPSTYMPQVESCSAITASPWHDAHPDLMQFFDQVGTSVVLSEDGAGNTNARNSQGSTLESSVDFQRPDIFRHSDTSGAQWEDILRQFS